MVLGGTGSVYGGAGWYLAVLGQYRAVLVNILCYWVSKERNWSIHDNFGTVEGSTGHTLYLSFFLHGQNFWRIKFTPKNANFLR